MLSELKKTAKLYKKYRDEAKHNQDSKLEIQYQKMYLEVLLQIEAAEKDANNLRPTLSAEFLNQLYLDITDKAVNVFRAAGAETMDKTALKIFLLKNLSELRADEQQKYQWQGEDKSAYDCFMTAFRRLDE
jgi:hypothetical protein